MEEVANRLNNSTKLISVDGLDGAGKTTLATEISRKFGAKHVEVDCFLNRNFGFYFDALRFEELAAAIVSCTLTDQLVILDGVLIAKILSRLTLSADVSVYVKRIGIGGWYDGDDLNYGSVADAIKQAEESTRTFNRLLKTDKKEFKLRGLNKEMIEYHYEFKPHENADLIFLRMESQAI
jgi:uridine kinase